MRGLRLGTAVYDNRATEKTKERKPFCCTSYSEYGKDRCSIHYIKYDTVYAIVLKRLQYWIEQAQVDESKLLEQLMKSGDRQHAMEMNRMKKSLRKRKNA